MSGFQTCLEVGIITTFKIIEGRKVVVDMCVFYSFLQMITLWYYLVCICGIITNFFECNKVCYYVHVYYSKAVLFLNYYDFKMQHFSYIWSDVEIWLSRVTPTWYVRTRRYVCICTKFTLPSKLYRLSCVYLSHCQRSYSCWI